MTDNVQRARTAKQRVQQSQWNRFSKHPAYRSMLQTTLSIIAVSLLTAVLGCSDYQDGMAAYKRRDYETALKKLRPLAEKGNSKAQFRLGWMYGHAEGVIQNNEEAVEWYRKAAQQDHAIAQFNLGARYATGKGVVQNYEETIKWYEKAIEQGPCWRPSYPRRQICKWCGHRSGLWQSTQVFSQGCRTRQYHSPTLPWLNVRIWHRG